MNPWIHCTCNGSTAPAGAVTSEMDSSWSLIGSFLDAEWIQTFVTAPGAFWLAIVIIMIADWLISRFGLLQISWIDFTADEFIFLFSNSSPPSKTPFPSKPCLDLSPVLTHQWCVIFNNLAMIRRTSAHLSDRAKVPVDFWFCHIDDDHAQLEQWLWAVRRERQQLIRVLSISSQGSDDARIKWRVLFQLACQHQDRDPSKHQCASSWWCVYLPPEKWRRIMRAVAGAPTGKKGEVRLAIMWTPGKGRSTYVTLRWKSVTSLCVLASLGDVRRFPTEETFSQSSAHL